MSSPGRWSTWGDRENVQRPCGEGRSSLLEEARGRSLQAGAGKRLEVTIGLERPADEGPASVVYATQVAVGTEQYPVGFFGGAAAPTRRARPAAAAGAPNGGPKRAAPTRGESGRVLVRGRPPAVP
ncbi:MAG: hypothetical protein M5U14_13765 [Acidimicrobiia bacterium]|nr:hypothetical protein [Acidimicrobiia bacterium]